MAKSAAQLSQVSEQKQVSFLDSLNELATPVTDLAAVVIKKDPMLAARAKFVSNCDEQIKLLKAGSEGRWFKKIPNGYLLTLRNGLSVMELNKHTHFQVTDAERAVALLEKAKAAVEAGELDAELKAAARAPRKSKKEAAAQAAPGPQAEAAK